MELKILIVEDDPTTCTLLKTILEMDGYQTSIAYSIENDGICALLNEQQPDILFLDYHLGSRHALDYVAVTRDDSNWQHLPIIMTSAIDHSQECLAAGATRFILKPFNWEEITHVINEIREQILNREEI